MSHSLSEKAHILFKEICTKVFQLEDAPFCHLSHLLDAFIYGNLQNFLTNENDCQKVNNYLSQFMSDEKHIYLIPNMVYYIDIKLFEIDNGTKIDEIDGTIYELLLHHLLN